MKLLILLFTALILAVPCLAKPINYRLDADKSSVSFTYQFNGQTINGSMPVSDARLSLDFNSLDNSTVNIVLNPDKARAGFFCNSGNARQNNFKHSATSDNSVRQ